MNNNINIKTVVSGMFAVNTYVVWCDETGEGVIIDPGPKIDKIMKEIDKNEIKIKNILLTHAHIDHVEGLGELKTKINVPVVLGKNEEKVYRAIPNFAKMLGIENFKVPEEPDIFIKDNDTIDFGNVTLHVMELPGHSPGSVAYYNEDVIFSGDVIFYNSIGRTDLPGGDFVTIMNSIKNKLFKLNPSAKIFPGHGDPTTIDNELKHNPFL